MSVGKHSTIPTCLTGGRNPLFLRVLLIFLIGARFQESAVVEDDQKLYVVYMGDQPADEVAAIEVHMLMLSTVDRRRNEDDEVYRSKKHVYSYTKSFNGFVARLSVTEAEKLAGMKGVVSIFPNRYHQLHTTRSWDFINFPLTVPRKLKVERNIVVGFLDTGITPQSQSFTDEGFPPPEKKWKGSCKNAGFSCNKKLIGLRCFKLDGIFEPGEVFSVIDIDGHGTHTSSTAVGNEVEGANLFGLANGVARGASPGARVAMYRVCWVIGCSDADILAAFDAAIYDGVDILSVSLGANPTNYTVNSIAIGSFHAMKKGILTVVSAGNGGPALKTVENHAPWLFTVAASGIDRGFRDTIFLGKL